MDLASLREAAANLTLYDIKAGVRKVQNGRIPQFRQLFARSPMDCSCHELHANGGQGQRSYK
jgi:hypothetical protein